MFASGTSFGGLTSGSNTKVSFMSSSKDMMSLGELDDTETQQIQEETKSFLAKIDETKADLNVLMLKTQSYSKNTTVSYRDTNEPIERDTSSYKKSPFGKRLQISDYSYVLKSGNKKSAKPSKL